ncbi:MAG: hypothetical protein J7K81_05235 [Methanophagales archaeon]|nr:hypothetical protein [Methanophagales archaeon]
MVKMHIVDTYAWIEYFIGSKKGEKAAVIIDDQNEPLITVECCLAEIRREVRKTVPGFGLIDSVILAVQEDKSGVEQELTEKKKYIYAVMSRGGVEVMFQRTDSIGGMCRHLKVCQYALPCPFISK